MRREGANAGPCPNPEACDPGSTSPALTPLPTPPPNPWAASLLPQTGHHSQFSVLSTSPPCLPSVLTHALHSSAVFPPSHLGPLLFMESPRGFSATDLLVVPSCFLYSLIQTLLCLQHCIMVSTTAFWEFLVVSWAASRCSASWLSWKCSWPLHGCVCPSPAPHY